MKTVTNNYKNELKKMGKELDNLITYNLDGQSITLNNELISNINYHYEGNILKSVMKQLDFETFNEIPKDTEVNYRFGIKVGNSYEYIDYGTFIVKEVEKLEDTDTYKITCYDKMLYSMTDYEDLNITYPITIKNYLQAICTKLGLTLKDDTFANQDREIQQELYLDSDGNSLGYKFRDVLDEIAQATGSTICINDNDELEARYINEAIKESESLSGTSFELESEEGPLNIDELEGETTQETTILPSEYTQVEYIANDGTNLINTGVLPSNSIDMEVDMSNISTAQQFGGLIGFRTGGTNQIWQYLDPSQNNLLVARWGTNNYISNYHYSSGERIKVRQNKNGLYVNNTLVTSAFTSETITGSYPIYIFAINGNNSSQWNISARLYRARLWNNGTLIRDFIPCYRNSDNKVGVYDIVNSAFYTKQGTNEFTKGSNVTLPTPDFPQEVKVVSGDNTIDIYGKNLLNPTGITSITTNGVTITPIFENGLLQYINVNGTSTRTIVYEQLEYTTSNNEILNGCNGGGSSTYKMDFRVTDGGALYPVYNGEDKILPNNKVGKVRIVIYNGITLNNVKIYPMIRKSNTNSTYEPYIGSSYPLYLGVENLFDVATWVTKGNNSTYYSYSNGELSINAVDTRGFNNFTNDEKIILPNGTYTISGIGSAGTRIYNNGTDYPLNNVTTFDVTLGYIYLKLISSSVITCKPIITKGSTPNYISSTPIELCKIGTYQDYIYKDNGSWYLHKEIGKYIFLSTDNWVETDNHLQGCYTVYKSTPRKIISTTYFPYCTNLQGVNSANYGTQTTPNSIGVSADRFNVYIPSATTTTDCKNKMAGASIYYVLANPTTTEITNDNYPELYSQLKAIEKARTLEGLTYIDSSVPISFEYIKEYETIDEEMVKNTRASFEESYGPINSIVLSRSADSDNVYLQDEASIEENGLHELKISDNQILNSNDRSDYLPELLDRLDGLMYNLNDYESIGITYLDLCDRYKVKVRDNKYTCIMFNDEIEVNNGLNEIIYTEMPQETETDYSKADKTDRRINQTTLIVDKQQGIIESLVEKVVDVSNTISGTGSITLENAHAGNLHYLSIKGNISQLFASNTTYPSNTRLPIGPTLLIDSTEYTLDIDRLRYINNTICDEFIYQDGECYIIRRVDSNNNALASEVIEPRQGIILQIDESSTISLKSFNNAIFKCEYLLENVYTDNFASQVDVKSSITQTENMIAEKVSSVSDENGNITSASIILAINKDESQVGIQADKIKLEGYTTINDGFSVDLEGNMKAKSGDVGGWKINEKGLDNGTQHIYNNGYSNIYTYADMVTIRNYILGNIDLTQNDITHYDLNGDGVVDLTDYLLMRKMILGEDTEGDGN